MIIKSGAQNFKVDVIHLSWVLPALHPSLPIVTQLEAGLTKKAEQLNAVLGKDSSFDFRWEAYNTYKSDNNTDRELT